MIDELLTTAEAADRLGLTQRAVQKMIEAGRLAARKVGRDYLISPAALEHIPRQAPGRPPKTKSEPKPAKRRGRKAA
jgi:excisionase family DNA binding protein